ncbi:MAG TPA: PKHD-type hydroxylase, partial [Rhizomicrobium sp.]
MLLRIPQVLTQDELGVCRERLAKAQWGDGRVTAGPQSAKVKENLQLAESGADARELGAVVLGALERNMLFVSAALPRVVFP